MGAGIVGLMVARRLSLEGCNLALFEINDGPGKGVTQGQASVIHVVQLPFSSLKSKLARVGNRQFDEICRDLGVSLLRLPALLVVQGFWKVPALAVAYIYMKWNLRGQFRVELASRGKLREMEPEISPTASAGLVVRGYGVVDWQGLVNSLTARLRASGVDLFFGTKVEGARPSGSHVKVSTSAGEYECGYLVNSAGLDSDELAEKLGADLGSHTPGLGVMAEFTGLDLKTIIAPLPIRPAKHTKGGAIIPTTRGTMIYGPTLRELENKNAPPPDDRDLGILSKKFDPLLRRKGRLVRLFAGVRPISPSGDFIIRYLPSHRTVNLVGIESPGLTASPAIADLVLAELKDAGLGKGPT